MSSLDSVSTGPLRGKPRAAGLQGIALVLVAALLWGTGGVSGKLLLNTTDLSPLAVGFLRMALSAGALWLLGVAQSGAGYWRPLGTLNRDGGRGWGALALVALAMALYQACYYAAVIRTGVAIATLISLCGAPLIVALATAATTRQWPRGATMLAMMLSLAGTGLLVLPGQGADAPVDSTGVDWTGVALAGGAAASYATVTLVSRRIAATIEPGLLVGVSFAGSAMLLLPFAWLAGMPAIDVTLPAIGLLLYLGLVPTALAYCLFFRGMRRTDPTAAAIASLLEPLTAVLLAWVVLGEQLSPVSLAGGGVLLAGLAVMIRR
jgi:drug/metabolite transporter, DME family